ncbi:MAG: DinB family protein [Bacteroidota bacterium]
MYRTINDFIEDWRRETISTLRVFRALNDASLSQKVTPDGRSLGFLAWHITLSLGETAEKTGLNIATPAENAPMPNNVHDIVDAYQSAAQTIADQVQKRWNDAALLEEVEMFGQKWKRGFALASLLRHQTHHRGQMTVLMRQAGLRVPGVCGPAKEEWARLGMPAMQ